MGMIDICFQKFGHRMNDIVVKTSPRQFFQKQILLKILSIYFQTFTSIGHHTNTARLANKRGNHCMGGKPRFLPG